MKRVDHWDRAAPSCSDCGTELTRVNGRRRKVWYWWCWKCGSAVCRDYEAQDGVVPDEAR